MGEGVNHVHLPVKDTGADVITQSMQLIAGRTAPEYNQRKNRHGAFWEDRYHATAIETDEHLHRCLVYIDLNMVRAGAASFHMGVHSDLSRDLVSQRKRRTPNSSAGYEDLTRSEPSKELVGSAM